MPVVVHKKRNHLSLGSSRDARFFLPRLQPGIPKAGELIRAHGKTFKFDKVVGQGFHGVVMKGYQYRRRNPIAIKLQNITPPAERLAEKYGVSLEVSRKNLVEKVNNEIAILKSLSEYRGSAYRKCVNGHETFYTMMRYFSGRPMKLHYPIMEMPERIQAFLDIATRLRRIHRAGYLHLDIWRENLLIGRSCFLHDFGCSLRMNRGKSIGFVVGLHADPETIRQSRRGCKLIEYTTATDLFGLGMTIYELTYEDYFEFDPADSLEDFFSRYEAYYQAARNRLKSQQKCPLRALAYQMTDPNPACRIELDKVIQLLYQAKVSLCALQIPLLNPINLQL